ncbi:hypothetical protein CPB86DRAFT_796921 [Serendipita vermifera]|nr:hypothetical protein CPB86DRAFT_796921 [Serendipita vermifera]
MSNPDPELYTIFCVLDIDPENPFNVKIPPSETLADLKKLIARERPDFLTTIVPATLKLYRMDIEATTKARKLKETMGKLTEEELLSPALLVSDLYSSSPPIRTYHIAVLLPSESEELIGRKRKNIYSDDMDGPQPKRKGLRHSGEKSIESMDVGLHLFTDFHRRYWDNPLDPALTTLPMPATGIGGLELDDEEDTSSDVLPGEPYLDIFDTKFLVRAEYIRTFDEVKAVYDDGRDQSYCPHGYLAVVTGQPGIGKTTWIYYALRRCVGEKQPVIWYTKGKFYLFSDKGVKSRLFPVYVTSPKEERWEKLHQLRYPKLVIMNPWTMAELEKAAVLYPDRTYEEISERFGNAGPSARLCLGYTSEQISAFYVAWDAELEWDTPQGLLSTLVDNKDGLLRIGDISQRLCVIRRSSSRIWKYTVEPISASIRRRILSQLWKWKEQDRIAMIERLSGVPGIGGMKGVLFESQYQHRFAKKIEIVAAPMFRTSDPRSRWHAAFGDFSASPMLHKAREGASNTVPSPIPISLSISPSKLQVYHSGSLAIEENIYYVPFSENEVAIDSFIVHAEHLYLFQFATGSQHSVNCGPLTRLSQFSGLPVAENWHFIFVVPKSLAKFTSQIDS